MNSMYSITFTENNLLPLFLVINKSRDMWRHGNRLILGAKFRHFDQHIVQLIQFLFVNTPITCQIVNVFDQIIFHSHGLSYIFGHRLIPIEIVNQWQETFRIFWNLIRNSIIILNFLN